MSRLVRFKPICLTSLSDFKRLRNRKIYKLSFVKPFGDNDTKNSFYCHKHIKDPIYKKIKLNSYDSQMGRYSQTYQSSPNYNGFQRNDESNTFVSSHYRNMGEDIVEYLNRKKIEYNESPIKYTLKFCPFCPPHRFKSDNLFKHEIFKNSGNSYCHRCGYKGSLFDFKAHMGDLPGAFDIASDPISNPFGQRSMPKDPDVTMNDINKFEDNLFNNPEYKVVLEYLTQKRGINPQVLRKYHVGAGTFKFKSITGKLEQEKCVVFPWLTIRGPSLNTPEGMELSQEMDPSIYDHNISENVQDEFFDYNKEVKKDTLHVNRIKIRSIYDKSKIKILPRGGSWGMFGGHLIPEALENDSLVLSEGEFDAMSIFQETGRIALSLPNGANSLPLALLPKLEKFNEIFLWMDFDAAGQSSISHFANKLGIQRVKVIHPLKTSSGGVSAASKDTETKSTTKTVKRAKTSNQTSSTTPLVTKPLKDANEILLSKKTDMRAYFENASVMSHSQILSFNDIRQLVYNELSDPVSTCGIKSLTMPGLSNLLKGHRRGELTVWTGSTGSGKTTLLSQLSLDYCLQGVSTLWGSFEINNVRLAKTMLRQFSGRNLENNLNEFDYYANKFNELPLRFLKFHGSTNIDVVLDAMDYAVYVYDVQHIIIDNLQFMLSNYSAPSSGSNYTSSVKDVYELQNRTIEKFRRFVTNKNVHLSLVVHPRKEADGIQLGLSSVFGSVKSTQEADNVIILQNILNESRCIDVKKNRFAGLLGRVYFKFDPLSLTAQEYKVTQYLNEYISPTNSSNNNKSSTGSSSNGNTNGSIPPKETKFSMSDYKIPSNSSSTLTTSSLSNANGVTANTNTTTSTSTITQTTPSVAVKTPTSNYNLFPNKTTGYYSNADSLRNKETQKNKIGLVGIDLLNLKPITQQINKIIHSNLSTLSSDGSNSPQKDSEYTSYQNKLEDNLSEYKETNNNSNNVDNSAEDNNNNNTSNRTKISTSTESGDGSKTGGEQEESISMRGLVITKNSSIKELREFVKVNGLSELVKTAGKGIKKESIYENIRSIVPSSSIINLNGLAGESQGSLGTQEGVNVDTLKSQSPLLPQLKDELQDKFYPFGVSTTKSLLKSQDVVVKPNHKVKDFKLKYLNKLPKSLYTPPKDTENNQEIDQNENESQNSGLKSQVYYSINYDPLLIDGIIYVDTQNKLESLAPLFEGAPMVGVDIETTGLDYNNHQIRLIQLSVPNQPTVIIDLFKVLGSYGNDDNPEVIQESKNKIKKILNNCEWLYNLFKSHKTLKIFHNGKFDINFLRVYGFEFDGQIFDTMIASKLLVASRYISCKLTHVSERYLNIILDKTQQYSDWSVLQLFEEQLLYSARDSFVLLPLYVILEHLLKLNKLDEIAQVEFKCVLATSDMELNGVRVDESKLQLLQNELKNDHNLISQNLYQLLNQKDINLNSQKQILERLQEMKILDKSKRKLISDTSETTLIRNISNPVISSLREYRKANKALTAFTQKLPNHINSITNRIYPNYNQLGAESGRFSCDGPNLQQVPREKKFRECFVSQEGYKFVIADFSQIELRIAAEIANDSKMIQAYQDNIDLHSLTASILKNKDINDINKEERQLAKAVNFGLIFGMSINGLRMYAETGYNVKLTQKEAKDIYNSFFNNFKGILNWHNSVKNNKPTMVRTLGNRLSVFDSFSFTRSLNYPVQGTSADITKETMARLVDLVKPLNAKIVLCVHDEILLEVPENNAKKALDMLIDTMIKSGQKYLKKVPVEAMGSIGDSWADKS